MDNKNKRILIVGNSANVYALAQKMSQNSDVETIFVTLSDPLIEKFAKCVDIRTDNPNELLKFVVENDINMTILADERAIKSDVAGVFASNNQHVFAPYLLASETLLNKADCKKFLYKMHFKTPKFAIFEKEQLAFDYLSKTRYPIIISTNESSQKRFAVPSAAIAKTYIEDVFFAGEKKIIIEEFIYGHEFTCYFITDGYKVLPITTCANYKFMSDDDGGVMSDGIGCYVPDFKITSKTENRLLEVVSKILADLEAEGTPYCGIIGVNCVQSKDDEVMILGFTPFFKDHDCSSLLKIIDEDLYKLFDACINGYFADDYEKIKVNDSYVVACTLEAKKDGKKIEGIENIDEGNLTLYGINYNGDDYLTSKSQKLIISRKAKILSKAREYLAEDIDSIKYDGKMYRKDICIKK